METNSPSFVVVMGTSAGGFSALAEVIGQLTEEIDAAFLVVMHLSKQGIGGYLVNQMQKSTGLVCMQVENSTPLKRGTIYFGNANTHLLVKKDKVVCGYGPVENYWRPSIDALFRSAAASFDGHSVGIILTGQLDDGTAGMSSIKRCGGKTIVQDPNEAEYPDMPLSVLREITVDYSVRLAEIGGVLQSIFSSPETAKKEIPADIIKEVQISEAGGTLDQARSLGENSLFSCPDCGGVLFKLDNEKVTRYKCHTGHTYYVDDLLNKQNKSLESTLWVALRTLEERKKLLSQLAEKNLQRGFKRSASALRMGFDANKKYRILLVVEDVTRRRQAEEKLLESLKLNTSILNSISDIFIAVDNKWDIRFINSRGEKFAGKTAGEVVGKNFWEILTHFMDTEFHKQLVSAMKTKSVTQFEYFDDSENEWYHFRLYPSDNALSIYGNRITEDKQVQELLQRSKEQYEIFIAKSTEGIWRFDLKEPVSVDLPHEKQINKFYSNASIAECNDSFARMYGYSIAEEMIGKRLNDIMKDKDKALHLLSRFIESNYKLSDVETSFEKGETTNWFLQNLVGISKEQNVISIWGTQRDITSKKMVEDVLVKTRQQLNFALAAGSVGTYQWDFKTNRIVWTKVQESLYGLKEFSFKGTLDDWLSFVHPDDVQETRNAIKDSISNLKELSVEFRIFWPDKTLHWILTRASTSYDKDGKPVEMSGVNIDISERKFKEQLIRENEERFKALVQNSLDVITVFDKDGNVTYQSDSIERVLGWHAEDQIGKNVLKYTLIHAEDASKEKKLYQKCMDHPSQYFQDEMRMLHKDGSYRMMEVGCINLINNASIKGIIKNYRDITERKTLENQKEEFIGIASHELKTPVTSIKGYAQILRDILLSKNDQSSADLLARMDHQIDRLTTLIRDLLDVTKITEGQLALKQEQYDLNEVIQEVVADLQMTTKKHNIIAELQDAKPLFGDKERTAQIIVNLLSNAIKYSPTADKIFISTMPRENEVTVCVQDFGIGIAPEMQKKLFTRFFRVSDKTASTFPGLGLGLFISTEIVRRQHGRIWVESTPNKGSTFCFALPYS